MLGQSAESKAGKGRGSGYDYLHTAVDDHSRYAFVEVHADEKGPTCAGFLARTAAHFDALGAHIERVMTDQAKNYVLSGEFQHVLAAIGARHIVTKALPSADERQGRAIQPHAARRVDVRPPLPIEQRETRQAAEVARDLQSPQTPHRDRRQATSLAALNNVSGNYS